MEGGAWWATIHGVAKSQTRLSDIASLHFRDLFKKIRDTKGTYYAKMGSIRTEMVWT